MKTVVIFITLFFFTHITTCLQAQVSGNVYRDFNGNGSRDSSSSYSENYVAGIRVKATLRNGLSFTTTTNLRGSYQFTSSQIPAGTAVRIEFSGLEKGDHASHAGTGNGSNVQFVQAPATTASFGINAPEDYWDNISNPDPALLLVQQPRGRYNGYNAGRFSVLHLQNSTNGPNPATSAFYMTIDTSRRPARFFNTGSIHGLAYQKKQERFFATAVLKRTYGLGVHGLGGVYFMNKNGSTWSFSGGFSLEGVVPSNSNTALAFGQVTRVTTPDTDDNYLSGSASGTSKSRDNDAFAKVGTMSMGGIDADPNSDSLYMINLHQRRLIVMHAHAASSTYNNASAAALGTIVRAYDLESLPGYPQPTGTGNSLRPYGIKVYKGRGYIGVVNDAMSTQNVAHLIGYVLSFDVNNLAAGFTTAVTIQFSLYRGDALRVFKPWVTNWTQAGGTATTNPKFCPQPIISDFEFNEDGSMDIGIRDRFGDQNSVDYDPWPSATNVGLNIQQGDILHACRNGNGWILEGMPGSCVQPVLLGNPRTAPFNPGGFGNSYNNTGREHYADVSGDGENESAEGTIAKLMGSQHIVFSCYDPIAEGVEPTGNYWYTQGLHWNNVNTGRKTQMARTTIINTIQVSKANGIGDIEFVTESQPIQVGNRIWNDGNGNGIQDAGEQGIANVAIGLRSPGLDGIYNTADDQVWSTNTNAQGHYFFDHQQMTVADARKPILWTGIKGILPGYTYRLEIDTSQTPLMGFRLSATAAGGTGSQHLDNDGYLLGNLAVAVFTASFVTQDFDFGFKNLTSIGDYVWSDQNENGIQDEEEFGVHEAVVTLYNALDSIVGVAVTNLNGQYQIDNVPAGSGLYIKVTGLPNGTGFSPQYAGGQHAANNSKADANGRTAAFQINPGEAINNLDIGITGIIGSVLPVKLIEFAAAKQGQNVLLKWVTSQMINIAFTELQHSRDGENFNTIYQQPILGTSNNQTENEYRHTTPATGNNYYRLRFVNHNGSMEYSPVKLLHFNLLYHIKVYPNPAGEALWIAVPGYTGKAMRLTLQNAAGQTVLRTPIPQASLLQKINLRPLTTGWYVLSLFDEKGLLHNQKIQIR
jgi:hypothetical protein